MTISSSSRGKFNVDKTGAAIHEKKHVENALKWHPPVERGMPYVDHLEHPDLMNLHCYSTQMLEHIGIEFCDHEAVESWYAAGASVKAHCVKIDRDHPLQRVHGACVSYTNTPAIRSGPSH